MSRIVLVIGLLVYLVSCATPKGSSTEEITTVTDEKQAVKKQEVKQGKKNNSDIIYQKDKNQLWIWVHATKGKDEFLFDYADCPPTWDIANKYLSETQRTAPAPDKYILQSASNMCLHSKGWRIEQRKTEQ